MIGALIRPQVHGMTRKQFYRLLSALACMLAMAVAPAQAKKTEAPPGQTEPGLVSCADSTRITGNAAYAGQCQGAFKDNIAQNKNATAVFDIGSGELSFDFFDSRNGHGRTEGTLDLEQTIYGWFVLGIKGGPTYSLYLFDGGDEGVDSIEFDTLGVARGNGEAGPPALSHAVVFTPGGVLPPPPAGSPVGGTGGEEGPNATPPQGPTALQVPEPGTSGLVLAALAAVGLTARSRRR